VSPAQGTDSAPRNAASSVKRILFVDDEPLVLSGLRNVLRRYCDRWDMVFVEGGEAALAELAARHFDVVVSDMRMPRMDGVTLLERVRDHHPEAARIILSGQMDREVIPRALLVAHQFLSKPCEPEVLPRVIERACSLASVLSEDELRRLAGGISRLPSPPRVYWDLTRAIAKPETSVSEIASIVERDPIVSARVLQIVNSGYYGLRRPVASIREAVTFLGSEMLRGLLLSTTIFRAVIHATELGGLDYQHLQEHSVATGRLASRIAPSPHVAQQASTAGLLHDLGKVVLAVGFPERFAEIAATLPESSFDRSEAARAGLSHAAIGGYLLGLWGLPSEVVEAVIHHHTPARCPGESSRLGVVGTVHVADALISERWPTPSTCRWFGAAIDPDYLESVGVVHHLDSWRALADAEVASAIGTATWDERKETP
jgi:putative nucleotidyltransferase with HDIG domain